MSTGAIINHGVSGYACLGQEGDFQEQRRDTPWDLADPIQSYMNAQSHIGVPMSTFNEPWTGGVLQDPNFSNNLYREPVFGEEVVSPPAPHPGIPVAPVSYPTFMGDAMAQQLPNARTHDGMRIQSSDRMNLNFEKGTVNGDNKVAMPQTPVPTLPNTEFFQGSYVSTGVHPQNDKAGQATAGNTTRPDMKGGQAPFLKLPNGQSIGLLQPNEPPALWQLAPPPDPQVLPGEGTGFLRPTAPSWW